MKGKLVDLRSVMMSQMLMTPSVWGKSYLADRITIDGLDVGC